MSFKVVNRVDRDFRWDNGSDPYGFNIPFPTTEDNGKILSVVEGKYTLAANAPGEQTIYFDLRLNTSDSTLSVTDTEYTVAQINSMVYSYTTPIVLRVQYNETDVYRLFNLYRIEETEHITKWCSTVSTDNSGVEIYNDLININDNGTLTFYRREVKNLIAGDNINISDSNVISAVLPTETATLLTTSAATEVITDGWTKTFSIENFDTTYDEIVIEIGANQAVSAGQYTISKGGLWAQSGSVFKNIQLHAQKTYMPSTASSEIYPTQPYQTPTYSIYAPVNDQSGKVNFTISFDMMMSGPNLVIFGNCVSSSITANLWPSCYIVIWGIKH